MRLPSVAAESLPWLSFAQMREVDRLMIEEFAISLEQMMENAGRNLALLARHLLGGDARGRRVLVLAGTGGNGGGGLAGARHLLVAGADVSIAIAAPPEQLAPVTRKQYETLTRLGVQPGSPPIPRSSSSTRSLGTGRKARRRARSPS